jgi:hypothetical protein
MRKLTLIVLALSVVGVAPGAPFGSERIDPKAGCRSNPAIIGPAPDRKLDDCHL